jgi:3-dehydroquinate dehydratase-1
VRTIDAVKASGHDSGMTDAPFQIIAGQPRVVGSFGDAQAMRDADQGMIHGLCDIAEVRLDLLAAGPGGVEAMPWRHLRGRIPLLFTARRSEEGGALALTNAARTEMLSAVLEDASLIDIEVASIPAMAGLIAELAERRLPWIASWHDFEKTPETMVLEDAAARAQDAGAAAFKAAAMLHSPADLARLTEFQLAGHGLPKATMGMGRLAPVSRLLCAQCGSVLNYGYLGETPTAPGQWDAGMLKQAITRLAPFPG